jgi:KDO2-lipid IV(A) lauroyltransferase
VVDPTPTSRAPRAERIALRVVHALASAIGSVPRSVAVWVAQALGPVAFLLARGQRVRAEANLRAAWPEQPADWVRSTAIDAFRHRLLTAYELMRFVRHGTAGLPPIEWSDPERLTAEIDRDGGVMLISAHLGNYWLIPLALCSMGHRPSMLATLAPPTGRFSVRGIFRTYIYRRILPAAGVKIVDTSGGAREAMTDELRTGAVLFVMADLPVGRVVEGRLLDAEHPLPVGPAEIARSAEAVLLPAMTHREHDGTHRIAVESALSLDDAESAMHAYLALLEQHLRSAPPQWLWVHRHWQAVDRELAGST